MPLIAATLVEWWLHLWPHITAAAILLVTIAASTHAILVKRDTRSAIAWVGLIWLSPGFGAFVYWIFGVNRIQSRASQLKADAVKVSRELTGAAPNEARLNAVIGAFRGSPAVAGVVGRPDHPPASRRPQPSDTAHRWR